MGINNKLTKGYIQEALYSALVKFKEQFSTGKCFTNEDIAIDIICDLDIELCEDIINKSCYAIFLLKHNAGDTTRTDESTKWSIEYLVWLLSKIRPGKGKKFLIQHAHNGTFVQCLIGFSALHFLCVKRYELYFKEKNTLDYVYAYLAPKYKDDSLFYPVINSSYQRIGISAMKKYNRIVGRDRRLFPLDENDNETCSPERLFDIHTHNYLHNTFTCVAQLADHAKRGTKEIYGTAISAARAAKDEEKKLKEYRWEDFINPKINDEDGKESWIDNIPDLPQFGQTALKTTEILMGRKNPIDIEIIRLHNEGFNNIGIAKRLSIHRNTVRNRLKKLLPSK